MTRIMIFGIILCIGLLFMPTAGISDKVKEVKVVNTPSVTVTPETLIEVTVPQDKPLPVTITPEAKITVTVSSVYQFAGYSNDILAPKGGIAEMHRTCQDTYGASARMCTTKEFWNSPDLHYPLADDGKAWIHPTFVTGVTYGENIVPLDFVGIYYSISPGQEPTCRQWTYGGVTPSTGTVVSTELEKITTERCNTDLPITCCVPATQ